MHQEKFILLTEDGLKDIVHSTMLSVLVEYEKITENKSCHDNPMTVEEAAAYLKLKISTIYTKVHQKKIAACKRGGRLYFLKADLDDYVKQGRKESIDQINDNLGSYMKTPRKRKNT